MEKETVKTYCSACEKETNQTIEYKNDEFNPLEILEKDDKNFKTESRWMVGFNLWQISKCNGCDKLNLKHSLRTSPFRTDDIDFYFPPKYIRGIPEWYKKLPIKYLDILREILLSINQGAFMVSLMGIRTLLDIYMVEKIGDIGTFRQKIDCLIDKQFITKSKARTLETAINAGNASIHRGYKPEKEILFQIMDIIDNLLQSEIIDKEAIAINKKIPKRKK